MAKRKSVSPSSAENLGPSLDVKPEDVKPDVKTIDIDAIQRLAAEVDMINKQEEGTKKKRKPKPTTTAPGETPEPEGEPLFVPDPEFRFMIGHITSGVIEGIKNKLDWTDPGIQWKEKVGLTVFRLSQRIQPMGDSWITDLATLAGYVGLWSASNVLFEERASPNPNPPRDNGKREDVQAQGTLGKGAEGYTL